MSARVLMHICCGPCSMYPATRLLEQGHEVTGFFYNPNIQPLQEYLKRREAAEQAARELGMKIIFQDQDVDPRVYLRQVAFREDKRCFLCHQLRLERTRSAARRGGFDFFSTTLMFSKMQPFEQICALGKTLETEKCRFLDQDFRPGWKQGIERSRAIGLYRQNYCGCIYSEFERFKGSLPRNGQ
ncbi:epoxyqueuosine reductase QueH [Desulfonatronospira sp.]|uniref:epoxyqueuosine reductase QueH n=1 Tax=Desulfonatronospira sp. TaxID=1962951 RepID=UPI0025BCC963|nr:epoxyqueuosine reductase QueH [Desulfonatronospira sp.]